MYKPGERAQSDFTSMNKLGVTIEGQPFRHLLFHFVLSYSNWETGSICRSESFQALSDGLQDALGCLGGVPRLHQTDSMSCAVRTLRGGPSFTDRYEALLRHLGMEARHTQPNSPHENGKIEQRHYRFKQAVRNHLILRGSSDFESRSAYEAFLVAVFEALNAPRQEALHEERSHLRPLPEQRLDSAKRYRVRVTKGSTVRVLNNVYSVQSRLIGDYVDVRVHGEWVEIWHGQRCMDRIPRLHGRDKYRIAYRHVIEGLVRKPGAFAHYRYQAALFPTHRFRMAYDALRRAHSTALQADKAYVRVLHLAATTSESSVDAALGILLERKSAITTRAIKALIPTGVEVPDLAVAAVDLRTYDDLLETMKP